jgi:hypothetical protein
MSPSPDDFFTDLERLRLPAGPSKVRPEARSKGPPPSPKSRRIKGEFLKGPIPLSWLSAAAKLKGKAPLAVALAVWFERGRRRGEEVRLTTAILDRFGVNRKAKYSGLKALEEAGLIRVRRELRRNPLITVLEVQSKPNPSPDCDGTAYEPPAAFSPC